MPLARPERRKLLVVGGLLVAQLLIISLQVPLGEAPSVFERVVFFVLAPVEGLFNGTYGLAKGVWNRYLYLRDVESQNHDLRQEAFRLRQENLILGRGLGRLQDREAAAGLLSAVHASFVLASAIGVDAVNGRRSIVIDRGTADGLRPDLPVVDAEGRLVGRTVKPLAAREATVELLTNEGFSVGVVSAKSGVDGVLSGDEKTGLCRLKYIASSNESLEEGEELLTSGFDKIFPAGIPAGKITAIRREPLLFKTIEVRPYLTIRSLKTLAVLTARAGEKP
jgi:rod shape-determining protein MreC